MKKFLGFLAICSALVIASCGGGSSTTPAETADSTAVSADTTVKVDSVKVDSTTVKTVDTANVAADTAKKAK